MDRRRGAADVPCRRRLAAGGAAPYPSTDLSRDSPSGHRCRTSQGARPAPEANDRCVIYDQGRNRFERTPAGKRPFGRDPRRHRHCHALGRTADDTIHHGGTFCSLDAGMPMIVDASARFGCRHRFVVTNDDGVMLFICESCGHRTDLLPVHLHPVRGQVVAFATRISLPSTAVATSRPRRSRSGQRRG